MVGLTAKAGEHAVASVARSNEWIVRLTGGAKNRRAEYENELEGSIQFGWLQEFELRSPPIPRCSDVP